MSGAAPESGISGRRAARGAVVNAAWTLLSRLLGYARDALMLRLFGATTATGNFTVAWMVPNLFRRLFGEGAVSAAVQPELARAEVEEGRAAAASLYARFQGLLALLLSALVAVGEAGLITARTALAASALPAGSEAAAARAADLQLLDLCIWLLPYLLPICMTALAAAPQQLSGRFSLPALAPAALNVVWIAWLLALGPGADILWLPAGVLVGGLVQAAMQVPGLRAAGWPLLPAWPRRDARLRRALRAFLPALAGLAAIQVNLLADQLLVRELVSTDAPTFTYAANRLLQLPMALVGVSAAAGAMPLFARLAAEGRRPELTRSLQRTSELTLLLVLAAGGGLYVLAEPVTRLLFEGGRFTADDTRTLVPVLHAYLWSLPAAALIGLAARASQACGDLRGPAWMAMVAIPVNLGLDVLLLPRVGIPGAGWATAVALTVQLILLIGRLRRLGVGPLLPLRRVPRLLVPGASSTAAAAAVAAAFGDAAGSAAGVATAVAAGILVAAVAARLLLPQDYRALRGLLARVRPDDASRSGSRCRDARDGD